MGNKMPVELRIPIQSGWRWGTTLQVFTDQGDGSIDTSDPLLARRAPAFPNTNRPQGWCKDPWLKRPWCSMQPQAPICGGWCEQPWCQELDGWCTSADAVEVTVMVDEGFGTYKFAVKAYDEGGNAQAGALVEFEQFVSGENPTPLSAFAYSSYDADNDRITFNFTL